MLKKYLCGMLLFMLFTLASCVKEQFPTSPLPVDTQQKMAEAVLGNTPVKLTLYSAYDSLFVGYNPLYISLTDTVSKAEITNATVTIKPVMDMKTMQHSCPVEQPVYDAGDKLYKGAAAFIMATEGAMGWTLEVTTTLNGSAYTTMIPVTVKATPPSIKLIASVKDQNNVFHYITLVHPQKPEQKTGMNDLEVAVYKRTDRMNFSPVDGLTLSFIPTMPSMGHDSPNNVNPTGIGKGHYKGKVNFSMTGDWRLTFTLSGNGSVFSDNAVIDVLF